MDADRFNCLARSLSATPTRRRVSHALAGLTLGGMLVPLFGLAKTEARKKKKKGKGKKKKTCKDGACLQTPFTIEARWNNPNIDHDTFVFVPIEPGAALPFPFFNHDCRASDAGGGGLHPFAYVDQDAQGPGDEVTTIAFLLDGKTEYWVNLDYPSPAGDLTVTLRDKNGNVIRSWSSPANPGQPKHGWHVFDILGESKSIKSINQTVSGTLPQGAHASNTRVCP